MKFQVDKYNISDDKLFFEFLWEQMPKEYRAKKQAPRYIYIREKRKCEKKWIEILNSTQLRVKFDVPIDWGFDLISD